MKHNGELKEKRLGAINVKKKVLLRRMKMAFSEYEWLLVNNN
jgi:hypothetical protein